MDGSPNKYTPAYLYLSQSARSHLKIQHPVDSGLLVAVVKHCALRDDAVRVPHLRLRTQHPLLQFPVRRHNAQEVHLFTFGRNHARNGFVATARHQMEANNVVVHLQKAKQWKSDLVHVSAFLILKETDKFKHTLMMCSCTQPGSVLPKILNSSSSEMKKKRGKALRFASR